MSDAILVANAGSSSIKFSLFEVDDARDLQLAFKGQIEGIGSEPRLKARDASGASLVERTYAGDQIRTVAEAMGEVAGWLRAQLGDRQLLAVGHRVVHGGPDYAAPVAVDAAVLERLDTYVPLAPLHQPNNLTPIRAIRAEMPDLVQVACFDTAFHRGHPEVADRFAIPDDLYREGVRRYGFHGLSYEYIARALPRAAPELAGGRVVVAHLGSGASMCAISDGRSVDSTMGFTALDGLPMGTRTGQLDPGVLLFLMTEKGWDGARLERFLYHDCGLKGLSGVSNDVRDLLESDAPSAKLALDYFTYRIRRETGALAAAMGGIDGLVFTAGIGENSPVIRAAVVDGLGWLGMELDPDANAGGGPRITTGSSSVSAWVVPTDEERMIARHTLAILQQRQAA